MREARQESLNDILGGRTSAVDATAVWVGGYLLRVLVFIPLWLAGQETALGLAQAVLTWPVVAASIALSWWVIQRTLPEGHPGLRHPVVRSAV